MQKILQERNFFGVTSVRKEQSAKGLRTLLFHGTTLHAVDKNQQVLRPSIIWCDSRAVPYGEKAF